MLITAAMIVKNEERFLDACLESLAGLADEVVVVDTGSEDRSREIAAKHGARVAEFAWTDDFSTARNRALELARGEWILYIDADERVRPGSHERIRRQLANTGTVGEYVWLHPRPDHTAYRVLRLFRNHPEIRFEGVIHESMWPSLNRYRARHGGEIGLSEMVLDHYGYEGDQTRKHARNLPLLVRATAADPLRIYAWCHLADTYLAIGNVELAIDAWTRAIHVVRAYGNGLGDAVLPFIGLIQFEQGRGIDATPLLREARERFPDDLHLIRLEGEALLKAGEYAKAVACFERLLTFEGVDALELPIAYDRNLFELYPYGALAACYFRMKDYATSRRYYRFAAERDPQCREYRVKEALCSRLEKQAAIGGSR